MRVRTILGRGAIALAIFQAATVGLVGPVGATPGPVTLDCSVAAYGHNDVSLGRVAIGARPLHQAPKGSGWVTISTADGGHVTAKADTVFCRRDGGRSPQHGGANIADITGPALYWPAHALLPSLVDLQLHVEDRGAGYEREDYIAWRLSKGDTEIAINANFLADGDVLLIPTPR